MRWTFAILILAACAHPAPAAPPEPAHAAAEKPPEPDWTCVNGTPMRVVEGRVQCASSDGATCIEKSCAVPNAPKAITCTPDKFWSELFSTSKEKTWCDVACEKLPGCFKPTQQQITAAVADDARKQEEERQRLIAETAKTMPKREKRGPPPPPEQIDGDGPCAHDSDCSMQSTRSCCGCEGLTVASKRHTPQPEPACGCGDFTNEQALASLTGEPGRCGFPPPPAELYKPVCHKNKCVGVKK